MDELAASIKEQFKQIRREFVEVLNHPCHSTIALRAARAGLVDRALRDSVQLQRHSIRVSAVPRDPIEDLLRILSEAIKDRHCGLALHYKALDVFDIAKYYAEVRRTITESKCMFHVLAVDCDDDLYLEVLTRSKIIDALASSLDDIAQSIIGKSLVAIESLREMHASPDASASRRAIASSLSFARFLVREGAAVPFTTLLQRLYVDHARNYYTKRFSDRTEAVKNNAHARSDEYLSAVIEVLQFEEQLASDLGCDLTTAKQTCLALQSLLVEDVAPHLLANEVHGLPSSLVYPNLDPKKFGIFLQAMHFSMKLVNSIRDTFSSSVANAITALPQREPTALLDLIFGYSNLVNVSCPVALKIEFHHALHTTLLCSEAVRDAEELIAGLIDDIAKSRALAKGPKEALAQAVDRVCSLLLICPNDRLLLGHLKQRLAHRLLVTRHPNIAMETCIVSKLSMFKPCSFTAHLVAMINDCVHAAPTRLCTSYAWPLPPIDCENMLIPPSLREGLGEWTEPLLQNRRYSVYWTTVEVTLTFPESPCPCVVFGTLPQLSLLALLVEHPPEAAHRMVDVAGALNLIPIEAFMLSRTLITCGLARVSPDKTIHLNLSFMRNRSAAVNVRIPSLGFPPARKTI
jgi:hypothetical protein